MSSSFQRRYFFLMIGDILSSAFLEFDIVNFHKFLAVKVINYDKYVLKYIYYLIYIIIHCYTYLDIINESFLFSELIYICSV